MTHRREPAQPLPPKVDVANLATAHFDCVYPTCGGICCMNGRPAVEKDEQERITANLPKFLPHLRPAARRLVEKSGFLSDQEKDGLPTLKVSQGWCAFWSDGCVLHQVGASEGDRFKYKPWRCALFPLTRDRKSGEWYVRQRGERGEAWDLFCLSPGESPKTADTTLEAEVAHLNELARARRIPHSPRSPDRRGK
ncbi:MAG TPA: DUF3109 family protein [Planctomycetota bacterium]|nr:DUF3109 family protein [Planctomycetota bacterium]